MNTTLYHIVIVVFICGSFWFFIRRRNKLLISQFGVKEELLHSEIKKNRKQIEYRHQGLDRYDFLKYNLDEALIVQGEIDCSC